MRFYSQPVQDFTAGDTVRSPLSISGYPATLFTLAFTVRSGTSLLTVAATANGDAFDVVFTATQTALLPPGIYAAAATLTETATGYKTTIHFGGFSVLPSLTNTTVGPRRAAYNAALAARDGLMAKKYSNTTVDGQTYTLQSLEGFQKVLDRMEIAANEEDRVLGIGTIGGRKSIIIRM